MLNAPAVYAGDLSAIVSMGEGKDPALTRRAMVACSGEVMRTRGYRFVSPTEFVKSVTGDQGLKTDGAVDLEKEYSEQNMKELAAVANRNSRLDGEKIRQLEKIDVIIMGSVERGGPLVRADLTVMNPKEERSYEAEFECAEDRLDAELRERLGKFLKMMLRPVKIYADRLIDAKESKVLYLVKATDGSDIRVEMDYTGDRPDPEAQTVSLLPPEGAGTDKASTYRIKCEEGGIIEVAFTFKRGKLDAVNVDTPAPDPGKKTGQAETLTMKSNAGYALKFEFAWDNGEMKSAKLYPALNPFGNYED
jgi:hypothetical protein